MDEETIRSGKEVMEGGDPFDAEETLSTGMDRLLCQLLHLLYFEYSTGQMFEIQSPNRRGVSTLLIYDSAMLSSGRSLSAGSSQLSLREPRLQDVKICNSQSSGILVHVLDVGMVLDRFIGRKASINALDITMEGGSSTDFLIGPLWHFFCTLNYLIVGVV